MTLQLYRHPLTEQAESYYLDSLRVAAQNKEDWVILVPDHIKFESEKQLIQALTPQTISAAFSIKVFSINRFIWYLLRGHPILDKILPGKSLMNLLMAQALIACQDDLVVLKRSAQYPSFVQSLVQLYQEFTKGQITASDLSALGEDAGLLLKEKLKDLALIFHYYEDHLPDILAHQEDLMAAAKKEMALNEKGIQRVIVANFYQFSSMEEDFLLTLSEYLPVEVYIAHQEEGGASGTLHPQFSPFYPSYRTIERLKRAASERGIEVSTYQLLPRRKDALAQLIQAFLSQKPAKVDSAPLTLSSYETVKEELRTIFKEIRRLVKEEGVRYRDILMVTRHLEAYRLLATEMAYDYHLPLFVDQSEKMVDHPLHQLILGLENISRPYYSGKEWIQWLRCGLFSLPDYAPLSDEWQQQVDWLENVVLAFGLDSYHPLQLDDPENDEELAKVLSDANSDERLQVYQNYQALRLLAENFRSGLQQENTLTGMAHFLYNWCETYGVRKWCTSWREWSLTEGNLERAKHDEQAFNLLIHLLDEMASYGKDGLLERKHFFQLLKMAFQEATYQLIPARIDRLTLTNLDAIQYGHYRYGFFFGLSDEVLPNAPADRSLLDSNDREKISQQLAEHQQLKPLKTAQLATEVYKFGLALSHIQTKLYLSYHRQSASGQGLKASPYFDHLQQLLVDPVKNLQDQACRFWDQADVLDWALGSKDQLDTILPNLPSGPLKERLMSLKRSSEWTNLPEAIGPDLAHALYGHRLYLSVTQLESYFLDPYAYFLTYGLKLKERKIYTLDALERGTLFHDALKAVYDKITDWQGDNRSLLSETIHQYLYQEDNAISRLYQRSAYSKFLLGQIQANLYALTRVQDLQQKSMIPHQIFPEQGFGGKAKGDLPGLKLSLGNGNQLILRGRIDRIDRFLWQQEPYLLITDYKSSVKSLNLTDLVQGLNLQMIAYMDVLLNQDPSAKFLGTVYSPLQYPFVVHQDGLTEEDREAQALQDIRPKGFILAEEEVLKGVNPTTEDGQASLSLPYKLTQKGTFNLMQKAALLTKEDFQLIRAYSLALMKQAGLAILNGELEMTPLKDQAFVETLATGKYFPISLFDPTVEGNHYRLVDDRAKQSPLSYMRECLERGAWND